MLDRSWSAAPLTRRRWLGAALALTGGLVTATAGGASAAAGRTRLTMPTPTGPHAIGTVSLRLVDRARRDPWLTTPRCRELMVNLWYPARRAGRVAPWMPADALSRYRPELATFLSAPTGPDAVGTQVDLDEVDFPATHAGQSAPVERQPRPWPVVLYSPGFTCNREHGTFLAEDLASHGYAVVTVSHTYDSAEVEFPGGRVECGRHDLDAQPHLAMRIRRDDIRFVLDALTGLTTADARYHRWPDGLRDSLDLSRVGMVGHSLGGATTAQAMAQDPRIHAGVNLDGSFIPDVGLHAGPEAVDRDLAGLARRIGDRPFMIMASGGFGPDYFGNLTSTVWHNLPGWRRFVSITGSTHFTYTDLLPLLAGLVAGGVIPEAPQVGVGLDPGRAVTVVRAFLRSFFDQSLRGLPSDLLDGPSAKYPEVEFYPPA